MEPDKNTYWYAVYTRPRWEKKVSLLLDEQGIENYCPLNKVTRQWSDRRKVVLEPVFRPYVFVRVDEKKKWDIRSVDGVLNYVFWLGKPAQIQQKEIDTIRRFLNEFSDVKVEKKDFHINKKVIVKQGLLMNYEGMIVEIYGSRAVVKIDSLDLQLSAHFEKKNLELM